MRYTNIKIGDLDYRKTEGTGGNDKIHGHSPAWIFGHGRDAIYGYGGHDWLYGEDEDDFLYGGDGNDYLSGGNGDDQLFGGDGNDTLVSGNSNLEQHRDDYFPDDYFHWSSQDGTIYHSGAVKRYRDDYLNGGSGNDVLVGGNGHDFLSGGDDQDKLYGFGGNDFLSGDRGNDELSGHDGDDSLAGGLGEDRLWGGKGNDTLRAHGSIRGIVGWIRPCKVSVDCNTSKPKPVEPSGDFDTHSNYLYGGSGDDTLYGSKQADYLFGDDDQDLLNGYAGNDLLDGGAGNDTLYGHAGRDELRGGSGNDHLYGGSGDDTLMGQGDADKLYGGSGEDELFGGEGSDKLYGEEDNDRLVGDDGHDILSAGTGSDILEGGSGDDYLLGSTGISFAEFDILIGGEEFETGRERRDADCFFLGDGETVFYYDSPLVQSMDQHGLLGLRDNFTTYDGYATIKDFDRSEGDFIRLTGDASFYSVAQVNYGGSSSKSDSLIYSHSPLGMDRIGLVLDTPNLSLSTDVVFVSGGGSWSFLLH